MEIIGEIGGDVGGQPGHEIPRLAWNGGKHLWNATDVTRKDPPDINLPQETRILSIVAVAACPVQTRAERVIHANYPEVIIDGEFRKSGEADGVELISLRGVIPWGLEAP